MFSKGDKFIHFTKYGGVNKGVVESLEYTICMDTENGVSYKSYRIRTSNGVVLQLDGSDGQVYKINEELSEERCQHINDLGKKIGHRKAAIQDQLEHDLQSGKLILPE